MVTRLPRHRRPILFAFLALLALPVALPLPATAQTGTPVLALQAEYDIGFDCPVSAALDTTGNILWVLMDNCFGYRYTLRGFSLEDGAFFSASTDDFATALTDLEKGWFDRFSLPMAFTPDGALDIFYSAPKTYDTLNLRLNIHTDQPAATRAIVPTLATLEDLIPGFTGYPEMTVYNADHTRAIAVDETRFTVIDLQTGDILLEIDVPEGTFGSFPGFSEDGQVLSIARLNDLDDFDRLDATLNLYSLPEGDLLATYDVPSPFLWLSPDRRAIVALLGDDRLIVTDLASGNTSQPIRIFESPTTVQRCLNTGRDVSTSGYTTRGDLYLKGLTWLPDSSGFLTVNSYMGDGAQGSGSDCIFNYSRLRLYNVRYE